MIDIDRDNFRTEFQPELDAFTAEQHRIEDALDADRDPFAGEDPPEDYLAEYAEQQAREHRNDAHGGKECDCPAVDVPISGEAPF